jgi:hypothetical protein
MCSNSLAFSQLLRNQAGIKYGIEVKNYLTEDGGTFKKDPGKMISLFTNGRIWTLTPVSAIRLKIELACVENYQYRKNEVWENFSYDRMNNCYRNITLDTRICYKSLEAGIFPEYYNEIDNNNAYEIFCGPSIGIGGPSYELRYSQTGVLYPSSSDNELFGIPVNINLGFSYYYKFLLFEIRYRYTHFGNENNDDFGSIFTQVGLSFGILYHGNSK